MARLPSALGRLLCIATAATCLGLAPLAAHATVEQPAAKPSIAGPLVLNPTPAHARGTFFAVEDVAGHMRGGSMGGVSTQTIGLEMYEIEMESLEALRFERIDAALDGQEAAAVVLRIGLALIALQLLSIIGLLVAGGVVLLLAFAPTSLQP